MEGNTQEWFNGKVLEKLKLNKICKKLKKSSLHIEKGLYKKSKYDGLKLISRKRRLFLKRSSYK